MGDLLDILIYLWINRCKSTRKFFESFDDLKTEEDVIEDIYLYIDSLDSLTYRDAVKSLIVFVNSQAYDTIYKRYRYEFQDYLKDAISDKLGS